MKKKGRGNPLLVIFSQFLLNITGGGGFCNTSCCFAALSSKHHPSHGVFGGNQGNFATKKGLHRVFNPAIPVNNLYE